MNTGLGKSAEEKFLIFLRAFKTSLFNDVEWNLTRIGRGLVNRLFLPELYSDGSQETK